MNQQDGNPGVGSDGSRVSNEFHIGGNVGAIATGQYGQATGNVYDSGAGDPLEMIDRLLSKLEADAGLLRDEQAEAVLDDVQRLHTEVHRRRPSGGQHPPYAVPAHHGDELDRGPACDGRSDQGSGLGDPALTGGIRRRGQPSQPPAPWSAACSCWLMPGLNATAS